ncbi:hypothetical protein M9H77_09351 [Catharanthus roseus]|uniref:Uncharacterized protein n=1 Tax=Catharanthus roseus TaxID=4058 RepID=A0ACC0C0S2_CATRO|nr:hypothetical protein M9H77_09351 [Catharanthus roseus]
MKVKVMKRETCASWQWSMRYNLHPHSFSLIDDNCDVDPSSMLIEMYDKCKKDENSKLICENKSILESLEALKKEKECSNNDFQKLVLENKNLCEKVSSLEKCFIDYEFLKKRVNDLTLCIEDLLKEKKILKNFLVHKDLLMIKMALDTTTLMLHQSKHILLKLFHPSPIFVVPIVDSFKMVKTKNANVGREGHGKAGGSNRGGKNGKGKQVARSETPLDKFISVQAAAKYKDWTKKKRKLLPDIESTYQTWEFYENMQRGRTQTSGNVVTSRVNRKNVAFDDRLLNSILEIPEDGMRFYTKNKKFFVPNLYSEKRIIAMQSQLNGRLDDMDGKIHNRLDDLDDKIVDIQNQVMRLERGGKDSDEDKDD